MKVGFIVSFSLMPMLGQTSCIHSNSFSKPSNVAHPTRRWLVLGHCVKRRQEILMDFAQGYPNSEQMWWVIVRLLRQAKQRGKKVMVLIWDNAPWHCSKRIREWIRTYNQQAKPGGEVRLLVHWLPKRSPWLNPIEPYWGHAKRRVCEPSGELSVVELRRRICTQFKALTLDDLFQPTVPM